MRSSTTRARFDPRARDAGVAEQSSKLDVLDLVLMHARSQISQRDVCALLCSSKPAAALTARHFQGQLRLVFKPKLPHHAEQFARWLVVNSDLLQSVELFTIPWSRPALPSAFSNSGDFRPAYPNIIDQCKCQHISIDGADGYIVGSLLAQGFAAAGAHKLQHLRSFVCNDSAVMVAAFLKSLPSELTHLELTVSAVSDKWCLPDIVANGTFLEKGLACMKGLKHLKLTQERNYTAVEEDVQTSAMLFRPLVSLTGLELHEFPITTEHSSNLPDSLVHLKCDTLQRAGTWCQLGHLTALTALDTDREWHGQDVLPPNLTVLHDDVGDGEVLRPLKSLRQICTWMRLEMVLEVAALQLPALTSLVLTHDVADVDFDDVVAGEDAAQFAEDGGLVAALEALNAAGAAGLIHRLELAQDFGATVWGAPLLQHLTALPSLAELKINQMALDSEGVGCIGKLTGISNLDLGGVRFETNVDALLLLPVTLAQLPRLRVLSLPMRATLHWITFAGASQQDRAAFFQGLVGLQPLRALTLAPFEPARVQREAREALAAATQLTQLLWHG